MENRTSVTLFAADALIIAQNQRLAICKRVVRVESEDGSGARLVSWAHRPAARREVAFLWHSVTVLSHAHDRVAE